MECLGKDRLWVVWVWGWKVILGNLWWVETYRVDKRFPSAINILTSCGVWLEIRGFDNGWDNYSLVLKYDSWGWSSKGGYDGPERGIMELRGRGDYL